jgi:hypothetical protein
MCDVCSNTQDDAIARRCVFRYRRIHIPYTRRPIVYQHWRDGPL